MSLIILEMVEKFYLNKLLEIPKIYIFGLKEIFRMMKKDQVLSCSELKY